MALTNLLWGENVRLSGCTRDDLPTIARWYQDSDFARLYDSRPAFPRTAEMLSDWFEERQKAGDSFLFAIRPSNGEELLGLAELEGIQWTHQVGWIAIGIGDRDNWRKGYGYETMQLLLGFAFREINLHRVQLTVFSYNERAIALYERLGFRREGLFREFLHRDGVRYDMYLYGLLRREWEARVTPAVEIGSKES